MKKNLLNNSKWVLWKREFKKKAIGDSRELTYELFKKGYSIEKISKERNFKLETTQGHIIDLIAQGLIDVYDVVEKNNFNKILNLCEKNDFGSLKQIYDDLKGKYSYFEIKCVLASLASKPE